MGCRSLSHDQKQQFRDAGFKWRVLCTSHLCHVWFQQLKSPWSCIQVDTLSVPEEKTLPKQFYEVEARTRAIGAFLSSRRPAIFAFGRDSR